MHAVGGTIGSDQQSLRDLKPILPSMAQDCQQLIRTHGAHSCRWTPGLAVSEHFHRTVLRRTIRSFPVIRLTSSCQRVGRSPPTWVHAQPYGVRNSERCVQQEVHLVEAFEDSAGRLMDAGDDDHARFRRQAPQECHDLRRGSSVQPRSWFV